MEFFKKGGLKSILIAIIAIQFVLLILVSRWSFSKIDAYIEAEAHRNLSGLIKKALENNKKWSQGLLETIANISYIQSNFGDRDELYDYSYPILNRFSKDGLSILNYYTPDGRLYLKATNQKDTQMDNREIALIANREDKVVFGVEEEKGKVYSFIASPIYSKGKKLGIIELGVNTKLLLSEVKSILDAEAGIILGKEVIEATDEMVKEAGGKKEINKDDKRFEIYLSEVNEKKNISIIALKDVTLLRKTLFRSELFIAALGLVSVVAFSIVIIKVLNPLANIIGALKEMENGDLRKDVEASTIKELATGINGFIYSLRTIIKRIQDVAESVVSVAVQMNTNTDKLSKGAKAQAESTESTSASINQMNTSIKGVADSAEGLSQSADESSASILEMTASINQIAQSTDVLSNVVENTSSAISKMSASIKQISENVDVLSSASEETASAVNEIATTIKSVEGNVNESTMLSEKVKKDASELGIKAIEKTVGGMNKIKESVAATSIIINRLGERSLQIGKILTVIDDVTDQTNLLALNAAIIAAQAGEHGRGFAVVADEIKDLAERTSASTKEIAHMIESIQKGVEDAVAAMEGSSENVIEGMNLSKDAGSALNKILESADKSAQMSKEIEKATKEQSRGLHQVNEAVQRITNMVRQIAQATQEQMKGSDQIISSVEKMRDISRQVRQATIEQTKGSKQINDAVENVNHKVHSIVKATKEQRTGSEQIVHAIEKIREITQQNFDSFTDIKHTIDTLVDQADLLKAEVRRFVI